MLVGSKFYELIKTTHNKRRRQVTKAEGAQGTVTGSHATIPPGMTTRVETGISDHLGTVTGVGTGIVIHLGTITVTEVRAVIHQEIVIVAGTARGKGMARKRDRTRQDVKAACQCTEKVMTQTGGEEPPTGRNEVEKG